MLQEQGGFVTMLGEDIFLLTAMTTDHTIRGKKVFEDEIAALQAISARLDDSFVQAVNAMRQAIETGHKIIVVGVGKSGLIGNKIVTDSYFCHRHSVRIQNELSNSRIENDISMI